MIERLIAFYQRNHAGTEAMMSEIWFENSRHHTLLTGPLLAGDGAKVSEVLETIAQTTVFTGLENGKTYPLDDSVCLPFFQRLAQRTGILPFFSPHQPSPNENWKLSTIDAIKVAIEEELGFQLSVPTCFGLDGTKGVPLRFIFYYSAAAFTIRKRWRDSAPDHILEIGAGLGQLGLITRRWNCKSWTVIDLPQFAVLAAHFTSRFCDDSNIWMCGEPATDSAFARFYPCTNYDGVRQQRYDLVFNCDSFPEIPSFMQDHYLDLIADCLTTEGVFLSINHESNRGGQSSVLDATKRNGRLMLTSRHSFAMMDGYVEEVYQLRP